jgi:hypothetical protein
MRVRSTRGDRCTKEIQREYKKDKAEEIYDHIQPLVDNQESIGSLMCSSFVSWRSVLLPHGHVHRPSVILLV